MVVVIGIDPGPRYTGVDVREGENVLLSSTYVRPDDMPEVFWAVYVVNKVKEEVVDVYRALHPDLLIGIEGVTVPNAYHGGKLAMLNPKSSIHLGIVVGAFAYAFPEAVIVRPGKNGSQDSYPEALTGRRPANLAGSNNGAGTRNHERSAFDVGGQAERLHRENFQLDKKERRI